MEEDTVVIRENPIKQRILTLYMDTCITGAQIRNIINSGAPGNKIGLYRAFRVQAFELYNLSHMYDRLNSEIGKRFFKWMMVKKVSPEDAFLLESLKIVDEYIRELKRIEIIQE